MNKKEIRFLFKQKVFKRDDYSCAYCNKHYGIDNANEFLDAHHITNREEMPNGGYVVENGISLCKLDCHIKAEKFHITNHMEWEEGLHPDELYSRIKSSKELAYHKSIELK
jgi:hypothetical protein